MRIALVCPNYTPVRSYQENIWAEQLVRMGHMVRVVWAGKSDTEPRAVNEPGGRYEMQQARSIFLPRHTYWSRSVVGVVRQFEPDLVIAYGDKLFSQRVCKDRTLARVPLVSTFSENLGMHEFDWRKPGIGLEQRLLAIGFAAVRGGPIRTICRRSTLIVGNTPQSREIILRVIPPSERQVIDKKIIDMPLGFSPQHFGFFPEMRAQVRQELDIAPDDVLVCVSSHFSPAKEPFVKLIIDALRRVMDHEESLRAVIVGFTDDPQCAAASQRIAQHIDGGSHTGRLLKQPFADRQRLCGLFNASDIAVFGRASISCQEALGTGSFVCFADDGSLNHLVTRPDQGVFFRPNDVDDLALKLAEGVRVIKSHSLEQREEFRRTLASAASWLGYDRIIAAILEQTQARVRAAAS